MSEQKVSLHRIIPTSPEKLYRAFTEALAISAWLPPYGFLCTVHHMDVKLGGTFKMSFQNFTTGNSHSFGLGYRVFRYWEHDVKKNLEDCVEEIMSYIKSK